MSHTLIPKYIPALYIDIMKLFFLSSSILLSTSVPGVTTRITPLFTIPFASFGSSNCSQIATLYPFAINLEIYISAAWCGTPAIGALSSCPQSFPVSVISNSLAAIIASSKNIS